MKKIILASASPRRMEILRKGGIEPVSAPADISEVLPFEMEPEAACMYLALKKAFSSAEQLDDEDFIMIAADTSVVFEGRIIGKPSSAEEAFMTLSRMRNREHHVVTGASVIERKAGTLVFKRCFFEKTAVFFGDYSDDELREYLRTDEPYDKAGGYAIQGYFGRYVDHIEGDYDNVVGLPWKRTAEILRQLGCECG